MTKKKDEKTFCEIGRDPRISLINVITFYLLLVTGQRHYCRGQEDGPAHGQAQPIGSGTKLRKESYYINKYFIEHLLNSSSHTAGEVGCQIFVTKKSPGIT